MNRITRAVLIGSLLCSALARPATAQTPASGGAAAEEGPKPNPGRPTVSTPATLTPVGYLQFENGLFFARTSSQFSSQVSVVQVTKLAVHERVEVIVPWQPFVRTYTGSGPANNFGGLGAGVQALLAKGDGARPAVAVSYLHSVNGGGAPSIDIGSSNQTAMVLVSTDLGAFHADINGIFSQQHDDAQTRWQNGETLAVSHSAGKATIAVEIWRFSQPLQDASCAGLLFALSHPVGKTTVVDVAFSKGLTDTSTRWEIFGGFTYVLPHKLW